MEQLTFNYITEDYRLFIDSSRTSLKAVLLHNGNQIPAIPVAHAVHMKETYENLRNLLQKLNYEQFKWCVCADLKVIAIITGLQGGYTKHCCFLCHWDSRAKEQYTITKWPPRKQLVPGEMNVANEPLVDPQKIFLPPLHIKLGLMKVFVKALKRDGEAFNHFKKTVPKT